MIVVSVCLPSDRPSLSTYRLTGVSLTLDVGYLLTATAPDLGRGAAPRSHSPIQRLAAAARS